MEHRVLNVHIDPELRNNAVTHKATPCKGRNSYLAVCLESVKIIGIHCRDKRQNLLETDLIAIQLEVHIHTLIRHRNPTVNSSLYRIQLQCILLESELIVLKVGINIHVCGNLRLVQKRHAIHFECKSLNGSLEFKKGTYAAEVTGALYIHILYACVHITLAVIVYKIKVRDCKFLEFDAECR